jgi:hypothetical protein
LNNIFIKFGILMKLVRLIKMCLTETRSTVWVGINLSDMFPIKNVLKKRTCCIAIVLQLFFRVRH